MLERLLKLVGFDLDARIAALKAEVDRRIAEATHELQHVAQATAMTAGFAFAGVVTALLACLVGLVALYAWVAEQHGVYAGLGAVGGLLVLLTLGLLFAARGSARSIAGGARPREKPVETPRLPAEPPPAPVVRPTVVSPRTEPALAAATGGAATASAADLVEPLAVLLSSVLGGPRAGTALLNEVLAHVELATSGSTGEAIDKATALVRDGDRATMLGVLGAAGFVGYLLGDALGGQQQGEG